MTDEQKAAFVFANAVAAMAEIESMKIANHERAMQNHSPAYNEAAFLTIIEKYGIHHNAMLELFRD